jgi:hypothetical protein
MGRRAKTFDDLPENWREIVIEIMSDGRSMERALKELGISYTVHKRFTQEDEEYADIFDYGKVLFAAYWSDWLRENPEGKSRIPTFMLTAVAGWREYDTPEKKDPSRKEPAPQEDYEQKYKAKEVAVQ